MYQVPKIEKPKIYLRIIYIVLGLYVSIIYSLMNYLVLSISLGKISGRYITIDDLDWVVIVFGLQLIGIWIIPFLCKQKLSFLIFGGLILNLICGGLYGYMQTIPFLGLMNFIQWLYPIGFIWLVIVLRILPIMIKFPFEKPKRYQSDRSITNH